MADLKISSLPRKSSLAPTDLIPIVDLQYGATNYVNKKTTISDLVAIVSGSIGGVNGFVGSVNGQTGAVIISVSNLNDVTITSPTDGQVLSYDAALGGWVNAAPGGVITTEFTVKAVNQGVYSDGVTVPAGTALEDVIKNMLQVVVPAVYTQPTLSLSASNSLIYEYGASVTSTLTPTWAPNDAGAATVFRIKKDGATVQTTNSSSPASYAASFTLNAATSFIAEADYDQGAQKTDNMGNVSGSPISAGTKTSTALTFTPRNKRYWGLSASTTITDAEILALSSELATSRVQTRNDFNPTGQYIYFAYPASFGLATIKFNGYIATSAFQMTPRPFVNAYQHEEAYYIYRTQFVQTSPDIDIEVL